MNLSKHIIPGSLYGLIQGSLNGIIPGSLKSHAAYGKEL